MLEKAQVRFEYLQRRRTRNGEQNNLFIGPLLAGIVVDGNAAGGKGVFLWGVGYVAGRKFRSVSGSHGQEILCGREGGQDSRECYTFRKRVSNFWCRHVAVRVRRIGLVVWNKD